MGRSRRQLAGRKQSGRGRRCRCSALSPCSRRRAREIEARRPDEEPRPVRVRLADLAIRSASTSCAMSAASGLVSSSESPGAPWRASAGLTTEFNHVTYMSLEVTPRAVVAGPQQSERRRSGPPVGTPVTTLKRRAGRRPRDQPLRNLRANGSARVDDRQRPVRGVFRSRRRRAEAAAAISGPTSHSQVPLRGGAWRLPPPRMRTIRRCLFVAIALPTMARDMAAASPIRRGVHRRAPARRARRDHQHQVPHVQSVLPRMLGRIESASGPGYAPPAHRSYGARAATACGPGASEPAMSTQPPPMA